MKNIKGFKLVYLTFVMICLLLSVLFLIYVRFVVKEYDSAQPERIAELYISHLEIMADDGSLSSQLGIEKLCYNQYEDNNAEEISAAYTEKVSNSKLGYQFAASESGELLKVYDILADDKSIGKLTLAGENSRTSLFFFSMADWSVKSFEPLVSDTVYNLSLYLPDGVELYVNGKSPYLSDCDSSGDIPVYHINGLLYQPDIRYLRSDGSEISYTSENNVIKPAVYNYQMTIPQGIQVQVNGSKLNGTLSQSGQLTYSIREMTKPDVVLTDGCGGRIEYNGGDISFYPHKVVVPEGYSLSVNGADADSFCTASSMAHPDAAALMERANVQLPDLKTYDFAVLDSDAQAVISDEAGNESVYSLTDKPLEITSLSGSDTIPDDIASQVDVMEIAKTWSRFMTDDLTGERHGLATVQQYLVKDSDYYRYAYEWATGVDISFTSAHTIDSFTNESITNFYQYNDRCFSCEVYFEKNMSLTYDGRFAGARTDVFHSIMYFIYVDDTPDNGADDPHWAIAVMHDVL